MFLLTNPVVNCSFLRKKEGKPDSETSWERVHHGVLEKVVCFPLQQTHPSPSEKRALCFPGEAWLSGNSGSFKKAWEKAPKYPLRVLLVSLKQLRPRTEGEMTTSGWFSCEEGWQQEAVGQCRLAALYPWTVTFFGVTHQISYISDMYITNNKSSKITVMK